MTHIKADLYICVECRLCNYNSKTLVGGGVSMFHCVDFLLLLRWSRLLQTMTIKTERIMLELELKLSGAVTFSVITKTQEKASEEMVCTTLEPVEAEGGGNAMLPSRPITVLTVCLAATYSYIFRGGARQGTVQI